VVARVGRCSGGSGPDAGPARRCGGTSHTTFIAATPARGEFVEVDKPHRLVFTWGWDENESLPPGASTIEAELTPEGKGTSLRFVHRDLSPEQAASHRVGWDHYLERLEVAAAGGDPGQGPWGQDPAVDGTGRCGRHPAAAERYEPVTTM